MAHSSCAVPDWPEGDDPNIYPRRPGVLGDWGLGQDVSPNPISGSNTDGFITVSPFALVHRHHLVHTRPRALSPFKLRSYSSPERAFRIDATTT